MAVVCPTVTAFDTATFTDQAKRAGAFARRLHVDLMDGVFTSTKSPAIEDIWLPHGVVIDIHLMYQNPMEQLAALIKLKPHLVIIHAEANVHHALFAAELHRADIKAGLALLAGTSVASCEHQISGYDHALIFSGDLGHHGGQADLSLLHKAKELREHYPDIEISWDGGVNDQNAAQLVDGGIDVLNAGSFVQSAPNPQTAYDTLLAVVG